MLPRFFLEQPLVDDRAVLAGAEAHHLQHVLRANPGELVTLFDGSGWEYEARIDRLGRSEVEFAIIARRQVDRESPVLMTLGVALPKGDRQRWLIEKLVELGVACVIPLITQRGVAQPTGKALERLRRAVIEASKQCGRNRLMEIAEPLALDAFLSRPRESSAGAKATGATQDRAIGWIAHPGSTPWQEVLSAAVSSANKASKSSWLAIGPEGGFTEDEVAHARQSGWQVLDLGPRILRIETAAAFLVALTAIVAAVRT